MSETKDYTALAERLDGITNCDAVSPRDLDEASAAIRDLQERLERAQERGDTWKARYFASHDATLRAGVKVTAAERQRDEAVERLAKAEQDRDAHYKLACENQDWGLKQEVRAIAAEHQRDDLQERLARAENSMHAAVRQVSEEGRLRGAAEHQRDEARMELEDARSLLNHEIDEARRQRDEAVEMLREARDMVECWSGYASPYFQDKHDLAGDFAKIDAILAKLEPKP